MAVLHDAALAYSPFDDVRDRENDAHAKTTYQFYYIELPDMHNHAQRQECLRLTVCAMLNPEIYGAIQTQLVNFNTDWYKALFVRVGHWAPHIDRDTIYRETFEQLRMSLHQLLQPNYARLSIELRHKWYGGNNEPFTAQISSQQVRRDRLISERRVSPQDLTFDHIERYLSSVEWQTSWDAFTKLISAYVGLADNVAFGERMYLGPNDPTAAVTPVYFGGDIADQRSTQYIIEVRCAHDVIARTIWVLAGDANAGSEQGAIARLFQQWNAMVPGIFEGQKSFDVKLTYHIAYFARTYFRVRYMLENLRKARLIIEDARQRADVLVRYVNELQVMNPPGLSPMLTQCVSLDTICGHETWLSCLCAGLVGNLRDERTLQVFKNRVVWGAQGLTQRGLVHVSRLPQTTSFSQVVYEINRRCGRMSVDIDHDVEAPWWQGQQFDMSSMIHQNLRCRIFPNLPPTEYHVLVEARDESGRKGEDVPHYIQSTVVCASLCILAVECSRPRYKFMPDDMLSELIAPLIVWLRQQGSDATPNDYLLRLAGASNGEPLFVNEYLANAISQDIDIRDYFITVS